MQFIQCLSSRIALIAVQGMKVGLDEYLGIVSDVSILIFPAKKEGKIDQHQE